MPGNERATAATRSRGIRANAVERPSASVAVGATTETLASGGGLAPVNGSRRWSWPAPSGVP